jgi:hypothetical protein
MPYSASRTLSVEPSDCCPQFEWPCAAANSNLDYGINLSSLIADYSPTGDTISTIVVRARPSGSTEIKLTQLEPNDNNEITLFIGNGYPGRSYLVNVVLLFGSGRTFEFNVSYNVSNILADNWPPDYPASLDWGTPVLWPVAGSFDITIDSVPITIGGLALTIGSGSAGTNILSINDDVITINNVPLTI